MRRRKMTMREIRLFHYKKQKGLCYWCGDLMLTDVSKSHPRLMTADHLIPRSLGGPDTRENIVAACRRCNCKRGLGEWKR